MNAATATLEKIDPNMPLADASRSTALASEVVRVNQLLEENLGRLKGLAWQVQINLGDEILLHFDCPAGTMKQVSGGEPAPDCVINVAYVDLLQMFSQGLDPRALMIYHRISVEGSPVVATRFLDVIGGRDMKAVMHFDAALPVPTTDLLRAKADLDEFGYCLIKDALPPAQLEALRTRLDEQAEGERRIGMANRATGTVSGNPPIQPVWNLVNKGQEFLDLLDHPLIDEFARTYLGDFFQISSYTSKIAHPGCKAQFMHYDQAGMQPPLNVACGLNIFFLLDDFYDENGGTRLVPGSHKPENRIAPDNVFSTEGSIAATAPAGSCLIFDTRLWHATGSNRSDKDRRAVFMLFYRSWLRSMENHTLSVRDDVLAKMDKRKLIMHGFRCTAGHGAVEGPVEGEMADRDFAKRIGALSASGLPAA